MNIISTIKEHIKKYPLMEVQDVCKLIYQSIMGGGHMIFNPKKALHRIQNEYEQMKDTFPNRELAVEPIGEDVCRIYLYALSEGMRIETLNNLFVVSANEKKGTIEELEQQLEGFVKVCKNRELPFNSQEAKKYVDNWREEGFPAISHSEIYRAAYSPAYRVVNAKYGKYYKVFLEIDRLLEREKESDKTLIVAIDGMAGSGKSTLGEILRKIYDCNLFHMDDFFLRPHQRTAERLEEAGGNVDYERFKTEIYDKLEKRKDFSYQIYDCSIGQLGDKIEVPYRRLNIIEGAYSMHPYFHDRADLKFFMEIPAEIQKDRIAGRNGDQMLRRFLEEWIPMEQKYFEAFSVKEKSVVI